MPIYEFVCLDCDNQFEKIQSFSSISTPNCPTCESQDVARQMSRPAIHFKGSGWYITDSKKADKKSANDSSQNGAENGASEKSTEKTDSSEKSSESTGDKKPAARSTATAES